MIPRLLALLAALASAPAALGQIGTPVWPQTFGTNPNVTSVSGQPDTSAAPAPAPAPAIPVPQPSTPIFSSPAATPLGPAPQAPVAIAAPVGGAPAFDYANNLKSEVFGAKMFSGSFLQSGAALFNPDHVVAIGDQLQVRLWGAYQFDALLTTDAQGNIFLPQVGPVRVAGVANRDLQGVLDQALRRTFKSNVYSYISLAAAQPVRVFVTGFVNRPGMYQGTSSDSVLRYLDQAGGIDPDRGSFLDVKVLRGSTPRAAFNLYDFLLSGVLPSVQLGDGDVVVVAPRKRTFLVGGMAENTRRFEFAQSPVEMARLIELARPSPAATHMRVTRNTGTVVNTEYYPLAEAAKVRLENGDSVDFTADKRPGTITVRVEGENIGPQEFVLPYGARFSDVMKQVQFSPQADAANLQLFRASTRERQNALLQSSLRTLEQTVLTARSGTLEEAQLRKIEADQVLAWTTRARAVQPLGQVVIAQAQGRDDLLLENGDLVRVPVNDRLVQVQGEVLFPSAIAFDPRYSVQDYITRVGGYSQNADTARIIVAHRDGSFTEAAQGAAVAPGDDILVLPRVDTKWRQFFKDVTQILFQIAVSAKVVVGL